MSNMFEICRQQRFPVMLITHSFTSEITSWKMSTHDFYFNQKYYTFLRCGYIISTCIINWWTRAGVNFFMLLTCAMSFSCTFFSCYFSWSQAKAFREFWGEKSELRRFHDSSILEAVVWPCKNIAERRVVCERIIKHLVQRLASSLIAEEKYVVFMYAQP